MPGIGISSGVSGSISIGIVNGWPDGGSDHNLLLEDEASNLLLESGDQLLLESA